ncbi:hypothetical protein Tco_1131221 [Tanacetum coccineum]
MEECHLLQTDQIDLLNPEGNRVVHDISKPLSLGGPPAQPMVFHTGGSNARNSTSQDTMPPSNHSAVRSHMRILSVLHPNDFEDLYLLHLQGKLNHLSSADKVHLFNADATDFIFKEDYTIIHKPRAVIYIDRNNQKKMIRETEVHKFSDGTLSKILEKLDVMVKDYVLFKFNPGIENRI